MADIATEMEAEMGDMVDDQEKTTHGREAMKAMGSRTILASSEDTREQQDGIRFVLWWVSRVFRLSSLYQQG